MGKTEVFLIGLADPQNDAVAVRDHHVVRQDQVVFRAEDLQKSLQIDPLVVESRKDGIAIGADLLCRTECRLLYSKMSIAYSEMNRKRREIFWLVKFHENSTDRLLYFTNKLRKMLEDTNRFVIQNE